ncbi:MAG: hypothetical protein KAU27_15370 [Desulfuromonadales bacterium]|nr:hypothetical protein [Desulfuromonadales bacterium]
MSRMIVVRLIAIFVGVLLFWGVAEVACRLIFTQTVAYDVEMWRYAREVKTAGVTLGLRFEHRPNVHAHLMGVDVAINADGLRNREIARQKPEGVVRLAVVGDSVTFGWGVPQDQTYPKQLEVLLNQQQPLGPEVSFEVINFGVGNYTAADSVAMLRYKALKYQPDMIIYGAFINDAEIPRETVSGPSLLRHSLAAVLIWGRLDRLWRQLGLRDDYQDYYLGLYRQGGEGRQRVGETLQAMAKLSQLQQVTMVVAWLPELHAASGDPFASVRTFYRNAAAENGATFIDLQESLPDNNRQRYWVSPDDAHPNAEACGLFARQIASQLSLADVRL